MSKLNDKSYNEQVVLKLKKHIKSKENRFD